MVVSCGHDEYGRYRNGAAGDQTGKEYYERAWYRHSAGWNCVLRYPDEAVGRKIAEIARAAAANNAIGYDQNERLTFYNRLKAANWHPENITTKCESDCSASTAATIIAAGYQLGIAKLQSISPSLTTYRAVMRPALEAVGFKVLTASKYLTSDKYLKQGDIILNYDHHVVINVTDGSCAESAGKAPTYVIGKDYHVQVECLKIRTGPGTGYAIKSYLQLTANAREHDSNKDGCLDVGTGVTCKALRTVGSDIWMMIPSGWLAAYYDGKAFIS